MPFQPGQSGNPAGRPPGARNKRSIISDARKDRYIDMRLPPVKCAKDSIAAFEAISSAVAQGELTPLEANAVSSFLDRHVRAIESATFEDRLSKLEQEAKPATGADL
jgi:hypothetical protein